MIKAVVLRPSVLFNIEVSQNESSCKDHEDKKREGEITEE